MDDVEDPKTEIARLDLELKRLDLEDRRLKARRISRWSTPLTPAALGLLAAALGAFFQLTANRNLERDKFEYGILAKATEQPTNADRKSFLQFVLDLGLIERRAPVVEKWLKGNSVPRTIASDALSGANAPPTFIDLSPSELRQIMPEATETQATAFAASLSSAMTFNAITTPKRAAAFLANIGYETNDLKVLEEKWVPTPGQLAYQGSKERGDLQPGDGQRFHGRGLIRFGGRANYQRIGKGIGLDLEKDPDALLKIPAACQAAGYWWRAERLNDAADANDFSLIVRHINGGDAGIEKRAGYYYRTLRLLSVRK